VNRQTANVKILAIRDLPGGEWKEFTLVGGMKFARKRSEITLLITPGLEVQVEAIRTAMGQVITGMFVPKVGWAFRMTNEDLAEYAKKLDAQVSAERAAVMQNMVNHLSVAMEVGLRELGVEPEIGLEQAGLFLATVAVGVLEQGASGANN
jgi:hypothetical protein